MHLFNQSFSFIQYYPFAGLQYARECFCGYDFKRLGRANNCNMKCTGNNQQICGGGWALSVYATGIGKQN